MGTASPRTHKPKFVNKLLEEWNHLFNFVEGNMRNNSVKLFLNLDQWLQSL